MTQRNDMGTKARKTTGAVLVFLFFAAGSLALAALLGLTWLDSPAPALPPEGALFTVRDGDSARAIARRLHDESLIRSEEVFLLLLKAKNLDQDLKAGVYDIRPGMGSSAIMELIASGKQVMRKLVVPEGAVLRVVAERAAEAGIAQPEDFLAKTRDPELLAELGIASSSFEGYLFPDTYFLPPDAGADVLIRMMVDTFRSRLEKTLPEAQKLSPEELQRYVTVASIVEREYRVPDEAPLMASVFWNRVRIGMGLQSCATVVYIITERMGRPHPERLYDRDLQIVDPYNTYKYAGLPPTPICSPGLTALAAAFRPAQTDYLYFRLVDEAAGTHSFSETLDEHIRSASLYVKPRNP